MTNRGDAKRFEQEGLGLALLLVFTFECHGYSRVEPGGFQPLANLEHFVAGQHPFFHLRVHP